MQDRHNRAFKLQEDQFAAQLKALLEKSEARTRDDLANL